MMNAKGLELPEFQVIGAMMNGLIEVGQPPAVRSATATQASRLPSPNRRSVRLGSVSLQAFADAANWRNALGYRSPLAPTRGPRLGALSLGAFVAGVNWANAGDGPRLIVAPPEQPVDQPPMSVEKFLDDFNWD
ncbi:MAG: hypothetical protein C0467_05900 [Planctomycetaceae bacterium]|nr:hypothetical protein [Planctomycetaceae bacterium]